jgi:hypothetical protein
MAPLVCEAKDDHCLMSSKLVESGEQIKMGTDRDFFIGHAHGSRRKRAKKIPAVRPGKSGGNS